MVAHFLDQTIICAKKKSCLDYAMSTNLPLSNLEATNLPLRVKYLFMYVHPQIQI
jgi:hypothetical protein